MRGGLPALPVAGQAPAGDDAVQVDVVDQRLSPGVEDGRNAEFGAEVLGIAGELLEGLHDGLKQQGVEAARIGVDQRIECVRQGEDDMKVRDRQQHGMLGVPPLGLVKGLALRAVAVAARVVDRTRRAAGVAPVKVSAQGGGATAHDGAQHRPLGGRGPVRALVGRSIGAHDIREVGAGLTDRRRPRRRLRHGLRGGRWRNAEQIERGAAPRQAAVGEVQIAGRGPDIAVAEQVLNGGQLDTGFQEMGSEAVPQGIPVLPMNRPWRRSTTNTIHSFARK